MKKGYRYRLAVARRKEIERRKWYRLYREWRELLEKEDYEIPKLGKLFKRL